MLCFQQVVILQAFFDAMLLIVRKIIFVTTSYSLELKYEGKC